MPAPKEFAEEIAPEVIANCVNTGIFPSVVIGQAILEGNSGRSPQSVLFKNFFGHAASDKWIKNGGKAGRTVPKGRLWRIYDTVSDAIKSHVSVLKSTRFKLQGVFTAKNPFEQLLALQKGGYDASKDKDKYALKIARIIKGLNLQVYDQQMFALERRKNTNNLAYSEQDSITRTLNNLFA